ncbi:MAG: hypothetical protein ABI638_12425 [Ignavibacteriota bacterium]
MKQITLIISIIIFLSSTSFSQKIEERKDFKIYFDEYGHDGCFILYDFKKGLHHKKKLLLKY